MELICKRQADLCDLEEFKINGVPASYLDFGITSDLDEDADICRGCGNRQFIPDTEVSPGVLLKYRITEEEGEEVIDALRKELSMGTCKYCTTENI